MLPSARARPRTKSGGKFTIFKILLYERNAQKTLLGPPQAIFFGILEHKKPFLSLHNHVFQRKMKWQIPTFSGLRPGPDIGLCGYYEIKTWNKVTQSYYWRIIPLWHCILSLSPLAGRRFCVFFVITKIVKFCEIVKFCARARAPARCRRTVTSQLNAHTLSTDLYRGAYQGVF